MKCRWCQHANAGAGDLPPLHLRLVFRDHGQTADAFIRIDDVTLVLKSAMPSSWLNRPSSKENSSRAADRSRSPSNNRMFTPPPSPPASSRSSSPIMSETNQVSSPSSLAVTSEATPVAASPTSYTDFF